MAGLIALVTCGTGTLQAADQTILGNRLVLRDPSGGVVAAKRSLLVSGRERHSANTLIGDPTATGSGGTIAVFLNGASLPSFIDALPQATTPTGATYWRGTSATGFSYLDSKGLQGPVKKVTIKRSASGSFTVAMQLTGQHGGLPAPPNPGTSACAVLSLGFGAAAERYSVQFGPESSLTNQPGRLFAAKTPAAESVCPPLPCDATGYPACGGACGAGEVCRPLSGHADIFDPSGYCGCVAEGGPTDCPSGSAYLSGGEQNHTPLGCAPTPTCNDLQAGDYPTCAGGVPAGAVCQPIRFLDFSVGVDASFCVPFPAGQPCQSACGSVAGAGVCPGGTVCAAGSAGAGMDCGCFAPPFCHDSAACGGQCPNGACITCPVELCGPSPTCVCSSD